MASELEVRQYTFPNKDNKFKHLKYSKEHIQV